MSDALNWLDALHTKKVTAWLDAERRGYMNKLIQPLSPEETASVRGRLLMLADLQGKIERPVVPRRNPLDGV